MKINGISDKVFTSYKQIVKSYRKTWFGLGKSIPAIIDDYKFSLDIEANYAKIIKGDATDYGGSAYSIFQNDYDIIFEFNLLLPNNIIQLKEYIISIFGIESIEYSQLKTFNIN